MKKILFLIVFILLSASVYAEEYIDVQGEEQAEIIYILEKLNIMYGYTNGRFGTDDIVSRGEFADMAARLMNTSREKISYKPFDDVETDYWAAGNIAFLKEKGFICGSDGKYFPLEAISTEDAVKIVLEIMGYGNYADTFGGYSKGYIDTAGKLGLLSGVRSNGRELTRMDAANLLYNALEQKVLDIRPVGDGQLSYSTEKSDTVLKKYFNMDYIKGRITANRYTSLTGKSSILRDEIEVDKVKLTGADNTLCSMLGRSVKVFYEDSDEGKKIVFYYLTDEEEAIYIKSSEIDSSSTDMIYTQVDGKSHRYRIRNGAKVIYNDTFAGITGTSSVTDSLINIKDGDITLIDAKNDFYVIINEYLPIVVNYTDVYLHKIYGKFNGFSAVIDTENNDDIEFTRNGESIGVKNLKEWDCVFIKYNSDGELISGYCNNKTVSGKITGLSDNKVEIDKTKYTISDNCDMSNFEAGKSGIFYLDVNNVVIAFRRNDEGRYGYFTRAWKYEDESDGEEKIHIKLFNEEGKFVVLTLSEKYTVDGIGNIDMNAVFSWVDPDNRQRTDGLIKYSLNDKGEVSRIFTPKVGYDPEIYSLNLKSDALKLTDNNKMIENYRRTSATRFLTVPDDISDEAGFSWSFSYRDKEERVEVYDADETYSAGVVVVRMAEISDSVNLEKAHSTDWPLCVVDDVGYRVDNDGDVIMATAGMYKGERAVIMHDDRFKSNYKSGDIIRFSTSISGKINNCITLVDNETRTFFKANAGDRYGSWSYVDNQVRQSFGRIERVINGVALVNCTDIVVPCEITNSTRIYVYNSRTGKSRKGSIDDFLGGAEVYTQIFRGDTTEVVIYED